MNFKLNRNKIIIALCLSLILLSVQILTSYSPNRNYYCCDYSFPKYEMGFMVCPNECSYLENYWDTNLIVFVITILLSYVVYSLIQKKSKKKT